MKEEQLLSKRTLATDICKAIGSVRNNKQRSTLSQVEMFHVVSYLEVQNGVIAELQATIVDLQRRKRDRKSDSTSV